MQENKPTLIFVGILLFIALIAIFWHSVPASHLVWWFLAAVFEAWTILNHRKADTISEAIWELSARPLVPWLFGALTVYGLYKIEDLHTIEIGTWLALQGHFFWQAHKNVSN